MAVYWNHNTAYHRWVISLASERPGDVLDVGCGDGLLAARLAPVSHSVTGIDPDPGALARAHHRTAGLEHVRLWQTSFDEYSPGDARFDLITFVATIHHMDLSAALHKARTLLRPSGQIAIVGLSANKTLRDSLWSAVCLPAVRIASAVHRETRDVGVVVANPRENLDEIRAVADTVIPGADVRRALYYRYLLRWRRTVG
jgi:2-polyprenyl-3-methyl-5-hydroxy-6-metoxy-1,4-benzoquinol methylase